MKKLIVLVVLLAQITNYLQAKKPKKSIQNNETIAVGNTVGTTTFDVQTNRSIGKQIYVDIHGTAHIVWTHSHSFDIAAQDRGTGYNTVSTDGTVGNFPNTSLEVYRTGWPNIGQVLSGNNTGRLVVIAHTAERLSFCWKDPMADWKSTLFESFGINSGGVKWSRMAISGKNIHVIAINQTTENCEMVNSFVYYRSKDGGSTWEVMDCIDGLNGDNFTKIAGDSYSIEAKGSSVTIVTGTFSPTLFKSIDNGDSWEMTRIVKMDDYLYDGSINQTLAKPLVIGDQCYETLIDLEGKVHVWYGRNLIQDKDSTAGWQSFPKNAAIQYWNETMEKPIAIGPTVRFDADGDGLASLDSNSSITNTYSGGLVSYPSATIDANGTLYVVYSAVVDGATNESNNLYRDVFLVKSEDDGQTWIGPYNVTNNPKEDAVFASLAKRVLGGKLQIVYQSDSLVGTAVQELGNGGIHSFISNEIKHVIVDVTDIARYEEALDTKPELLVLEAEMGFEGCVTYGVDQLQQFTLDFPDGELSANLSGEYMENLGTIGSYDLVATVTDNDGNTDSTIVENLTVITDKENPVIIAQPFFTDNQGNIQTHFEFFDTVAVLVGQNYQDLGAAIFDNEAIQLPENCQATLTTQLDERLLDGTAPIGNYTVNYIGEDINGKQAITVSRTVHVIDNDTLPPVITFYEAESQTDFVAITDTFFVEASLGGEFTYPAFLAYDNVDGIITAMVSVVGTVDIQTIGTYTLMYTLTDSAGNTTAVEKIVVVQDTTPPVISLAGPNPMILAEQNGTFTCGQEFADPGLISAIDEGDASFSALDVKVSGCIYTRCVLAGVPNFDTLYYTGCDATGNCTTVARAVILNVVEPCELNCDAVAIETCDYMIICDIACEPEPMSIEELTTEQITIYPNPSTGQFTIDVGNIREEGIITIYSLAGSLIKTIPMIAGIQTVRMEMNKVNTGIYFVNITTRTKTIVKKILINK